MESVHEEWRAVKVERYEDAYEVSNLGRVRSVDRVFEQGGRNGGTCKHRLRGRVLRQRIQNSGYRVVDLSVGGVKRTFLVHILVAGAFIGPCPEGMEVDHKDRVKLNNVASNLQYKTHRDNVQTAAYDERGFNRGESNGQATVTNELVLKIAEDLKTMRGVDVARKYGQSVDLVSRINTGEKWGRITGIPRRRAEPILTPEKLAEIREMRRLRAEGLTVPAIAAKLGRPEGTVSKIVNRERHASVA